MIRHTVPEGVLDMPLSRYARRAWPMLSPGRVREALKKRDARVNGVKSGADAIVRAGDEIILYIDTAPDRAPVEVLFDDGQLMAAVKPQELPVDSDAAGVGEDTLINRLRASHPGSRLVHRLDAGTGGVMLIARTEEMERLLLAAFRTHSLLKRYRAIVSGAPARGTHALTAYLYKDAVRAQVRVTGEKRPDAVKIETMYRVLATREAGADTVSLIEVTLITGRTHQIRAHMAFAGHPIVGDDKYGDRALNKRLRAKRLCLWCRCLALQGAEGLSRYDGMTFEKAEPVWKGFEDIVIP